MWRKNVLMIEVDEIKSFIEESILDEGDTVDIRIFNKYLYIDDEPFVHAVDVMTEMSGIVIEDFTIIEQNGQKIVLAIPAWEELW